MLTGALFICFASNAETVTYVHTDALGTPVAETDESGNVLWREHYTPFGAKLENSEASQANRVGYTGHQFDNDTGLVYMQARYYDPVIGRFYSNDPAGFSNVHNFNRYTYANNNPYRYTDPDGKNSMDMRLDLRVERLGSGEITKSEYKAENSAEAAGGLAAVTLLVPGPEDVVIGAAVAKLSRGAESAVSAVKLEKQLASQSQVSQLANGGGTVISQPAKQANRIASQTGANASDIQKVSSNAHVAKDGQTIQTHSFREASTNKLIEPKTMID